MTTFAGVYINLESSVVRRLRMETQLRERGLDGMVRRLAAVAPDHGQGSLPPAVFGCLQSHMAAIAHADHQRHLIVLEDDVVIAPQMPGLLPRFAKALERGDTDVLFLGQTVTYLDVRTHRVLLGMMREAERQSGALRFLKGEMYRYGTFAYMIRSGAIPKVLHLLDGCAAAGLWAPFDVLLQGLVKSRKLQASITFPYVVGVDPQADSTLVDRNGAGTHLAHCRLVNQYMLGQALPRSADDWAQLLTGEPDPRALAIAWEFYQRLTERHQ